MEESKNIKICCITFNLKQKSLSQEQIKSVLLPHKQKNFDIYIISTQECQRVTFVNIFYNNKSSFELKLEEFFGDNFYNLKSKTLGGIHLIIFAKKFLKSHIDKYSSNSIKTGFYGLLGNKGAISIYIEIFKISFLLINSHFIKGENNIVDRNCDSSFIYKSIHPKIDKINVIIWMGCLNYKVEAKLEIFSEAYIKGKELSLLEKDQMIKQRKNEEFVFNKFKEGEIKFLPTSKYDKNNKIDWINKDHYPGWTDRIFYKTNQNANINFSFDLIKYDSMQSIKFSDHKPVFAYFIFGYNNL